MSEGGRPHSLRLDSSPSLVALQAPFPLSTGAPPPVVPHQYEPPWLYGRLAGSASLTAA